MDSLVIKQLDEKIASQTAIIQHHRDQPEDIKSDVLWLTVHAYNIAFLHGLRWARDILVENELRKQESPNREDLK